MKQFLSFILAAIAGGLIAVGSMTFLQQEDSQPLSNPLPKLAATNTTTTSSNVPFDFKSAAAKAAPAVVHIKSKRTKAVTGNNSRSNNPFEFFFGEEPFGNPFGGSTPQQGMGSGVIYTADGYIITNNHVIDFADEYEVTLLDNRKFNATLVGTYSEADLAVLKIDAKGLPTIPLSNSDNAEIGEWVLAVGNPFDLGSTVTAGIISAKGRDINIIRSKDGGNAIESFIQTDAAVNPGNSGGALVDAEGNLLGINTAIATKTGSFAGYSFAIPINLANRIVDDIIENGSYRRAMLGVSISEIDNEFVQENNLNFTQGLIVQEVVAEGAADAAGIQAGDIIVAVNGKPTRTFPELQEVISSSKVGKEIQIRVYRNSNFKEVKVVL